MCFMCDENGGEMIGCPDCGRSICFDVKGSGDDVIAPAYVTASGDIFCLQHGRQYDEEEECQADEEFEGYDFSDIFPVLDEPILDEPIVRDSSEGETDEPVSP